MWQEVRDTRPEKYEKWEHRRATDIPQVYVGCGFQTSFIEPQGPRGLLRDMEGGKTYGGKTLDPPIQM